MTRQALQRHGGCAGDLRFRSPENRARGGAPNPLRRRFPMDFRACLEVCLAGRWYTKDARHNHPCIGRIVMGRGRDATNVATSTAFGLANLVRFQVVTHEQAQAGSRVCRGALSRELSGASSVASGAPFRTWKLADCDAVRRPVGDFACRSALRQLASPHRRHQHFGGPITGLASNCAPHLAVL